MNDYRCKICGGLLKYNEADSYCVCEYCGNIQTFPKINYDSINRLLSRADIYRRSNQYDEAAKLYNKILDQEKEDPEIYWLLLLCQYGVEYVDDPKTHLKIQTINRLCKDSIYDNPNYIKCIELADSEQRKIYESEARVLSDNQNSILEIAIKEKPYDVFICYKETDNNGKRTEDSVIAYDLYKRLTNEGLRVFFSKISLMDKIGYSFEPYIYSALNTAKYMFVVSTSPEYLNSVWVKNEWIRFLNATKTNPKKYIIPCLKNFQSDDLPTELKGIQYLDLDNIGWKQEIDILLNRDKSRNIAENDNYNVFIEKATIALRNENFENARRLYDRALDYDYNSEEAHLGKLCSSLYISNIHSLKELKIDITDNDDYKWVIEHASENIKKEVIEYARIALLKYKTNLESAKNKKKKGIFKIITAITVVVIVVVIVINVAKQSATNNAIDNAYVGDIIEFGSYEQDNSSINGKEPLEWIVLDVNGDEVLLVTRYVIDCQSYYSNNAYVQSSESYIKQWLNNDFAKEAFSSKELNKIAGEVSLLDVNQAKNLFASTSERTGIATEYAKARGIGLGSSYGNCEYWLYPSNSLSHFSAKVNVNGSISSKAESANDLVGVRPSIIVKKSHSNTTHSSFSTNTDCTAIITDYQKTNTGKIVDYYSETCEESELIITLEFINFNMPIHVGSMQFYDGKNYRDLFLDPDGCIYDYFYFNDFSEVKQNFDINDGTVIINVSIPSYYDLTEGEYIVINTSQSGEIFAEF